MTATYTTRQLAGALGVSESSIRRWVDRGAIRSTRTEGGHRRIALADALDFARTSGLRWGDSSALGLTTLPSRVTDVAGEVYDAFVRGDEEAARSIVLGEFLAGRSVAELCDEVLRPALRRVGELYLESENGILVEHRATTLTSALLHQLHTLLPTGDGPCAVGGAVAHDPYTLPTLMARVTLTGAGFDTTDLGANTPTSVFEHAVAQHQARLIWLSVSRVEDRAQLSDELGGFLTRMSDQGRVVVLGGRGLAELHLVERPNVHRARSMSELAALGATLAEGIRIGRDQVLPRGETDDA